MVYMGKNEHNAAMDKCKMLNAQLPLPKSKGEADEFRKITGSITGSGNTWIGIKDSNFSGKANWTDVEGIPIGNRYVNLRVIE